MIRFFVVGDPRPAGSKRAFVNPRTQRAVLTDASGARGREWRTDVRAAALEAMTGPPLDEALKVVLSFRMRRPRSHYGTGRNAAILKASAPLWHASRPDVDKLSRAVLDALTGVCWRDDGCVAKKVAEKSYESLGSPGVEVTIQPLTDGAP